MMKIRKIIPFLLGVALVSTAQAHNHGAEHREAPDFTLPSITGETHSLSDFEGQVVVLEWLNHLCPFVVKFYREGHLPTQQERWREQGVVWLSINSTHSSNRQYLTPEQEAAKAAEVGSNATAILHDADGTMGRAYNARTTPHIIIINADGNIVYDGAIDSVRSANPADIENAENHVDTVLAAILAGEPSPIATTRPYGCSVKFEGVR